MKEKTSDDMANVNILVRSEQVEDQEEGGIGRLGKHALTKGAVSKHEMNKLHEWRNGTSIQ